MIETSRDFRDVGDLYSPFFKVEFLDSQVGPPVENFSSAGPTNPNITPFNNAFSNALTASINTPELTISGGADSIISGHLTKIAASLTAESTAGHPYHFVLTLTPEYDDALKIIASRILGYATIVKVQWGYTSSSSSHIITNENTFRNILPKIKFGEHISIVVEGWDTVSSIASRRTSNTDWTVSPFDIIANLIGRAKPFKLSRVETIKAVPGGESHPIFTKPTGPIKQNLTDWKFIHLLMRNAGLTFVIKDNTFVIYDPINPVSSKAAYVFKWRQSLTGPRDIPVTSIDANYLQYFFQPPAGRGLKALCYDDNTGLWTANDLDSRDTGGKSGKDANASSNSAGGRSAAFGATDPDGTDGKTAKGGSGEENTSVAPTGTDGEETGIKFSCPLPPKGQSVPGGAITIVKEAQVFGSPTIKLKAPGVVDMFPGLIVYLSGATEAFDAYYIVLSVKHTISNSGYDMDVSMYRWHTFRNDTIAERFSVFEKPDDSTSGGDTGPTAVFGK